MTDITNQTSQSPCICTSAQPDSASAEFDKLFSAFYGSTLAVVAALVAVWPTDRFARKRENTTALRDRELAELRNSFERKESIRRESTQRKLDALELAAGAVAPALSELRTMRVAADDARFPERIVGPISAGTAPLLIHFDDEFAPAIKTLECQYSECIKCVSALALANSWLARRRDGLSPNTGVEGERQNQQTAISDYNKALDQFEKSIPKFIDQLTAAAKPLTAIPE